MYESVKEYMDEQREAVLEEKRNKLIHLGLYKRLYSSNSIYTEEYPKYDYNRKEYYRVEPLEVSDEEYEKILEFQRIKKKS